MKKFSILIIAFVCIAINSVKAQDQFPNSFFNDRGGVRLETEELDGLSDTIVRLFHRADDVVWSRIVYRVIDMRYKQNFQLYFPIRPNEEYRSLFRVVLDAICDGMPVYRKNPREIKPSFSETLCCHELSRVFAYDPKDPTGYVNPEEDHLIVFDSISQKYSVNDYRYNAYVKNQIKFLIQEIVFFDKHMSRLFTKIIAIAPLYALHPDNMATNNTMEYFRNSVLCWISFDELRPYLVRQYMMPLNNDTHRLTFDEFFIKKNYTSYLLGDSNVFGRMLLDDNATVSEEDIKREQERIEREMLDFEQDLWEY
jgi:gliding motility associated protien GldN